MDFSEPDVYRKRAFTDLHKRMVAQLEANDSLLFFQKLMNRNQRHLEKMRVDTSRNIDKCLDRSLLVTSLLYYAIFFSGNVKAMYQYGDQNHSGDKRKTHLTNLAKKYEDSLWFKRKKHEVLVSFCLVQTQRTKLNLSRNMKVTHRTFKLLLSQSVMDILIFLDYVNNAL